ncbi:hypothetical protein FRC11_011012 [Ceratobasidium sp. 423]|nr:hypothetical protein FRC11_011012 [Ceratobasidium sp. 423]
MLVVISLHSDPEIVMIEDEYGVEQPWPVILRPETIEKNRNLRELMDLGSNSDAEDDATNDAQKAIYRSICARIRHATNAIIPGAMHGKLKWKQVTSAERTAVHNEVVELNPYLRRFPGGWITEVVMQRQLRNARDTAARDNDSDEEQLYTKVKPLNLLSKKSCTSKVKGKSHAPGKGRIAPAASAPAVRGSKPALGSTKGVAQKKRALNNDVIADRQSQDPTTANHSEPDISQEGVDADAASKPNKKAKTLSGKAHSSTTTRPQKGPKTSTTSKNKKTVRNIDPSSGSEEDWDEDVDCQVAELKSKKHTKEAPITKSSQPKSCPKPRPVSARKGGRDGEKKDFFCLDTHGEKQELIDEAEGIMVGPSKPKATSKSKKRVVTTKK